MKKMIIKNSDFLAFQSEIAVEYGLNEAIILQKFHYWTKLNAKDNRNLRNGYYWVYVTLDDLSGQLLFFSRSTVQRTLKNLKNEGVLIVSNYNQRKYDKTVWYRIDYEKLEKTIKAHGQIDHMDIVKMNTPIPKKNKEEISDKYNGFFEEKNESVSKPSFKPEHPIIKDIMNYYINEAYLREIGSSHPRIKKEQRQRVHDVLLNFGEDLLGLSQNVDYDPDVFNNFTAIVDHFLTAYPIKQTDYNVNHFASYKILEHIFYEILY